MIFFGETLANHKLFLGDGDAPVPPRQNQEDKVRSWLIVVRALIVVTHDCRGHRDDTLTKF